jgi:(2R)-3-sulfolactate dehydrogenase (NADP+)
MNSVTLPLQDVENLAVEILVAHNTGEANARSVARALVAAESDGQGGHGLSRLGSYAGQAKSGKVAGHAVPEIIGLTPAAVRIDARNGFAYPAMDLAVGALAKRANAMGVAAAAVFNSHHFGVAGYHVERLANAGIVGLLFSNSPEAIAPWGGRKAVFGTNPIAFGAPRRGSHPLVIDLSLSKVARGKIMVAAKRDEPIPEGWALDADGNPTTDAKAAMAGTMLPMGDAKGAALVLIVEILAAALTGGNFGFQASSFFTAEGDPPSIGHLMIGLDPYALSGGTFSDRLEELVSAISEQPETRLPGARRIEAREAARKHGIILTSSVHAELLALAGRKTDTPVV